MNYRQLTRRLRQLGCEFVRQAHGSYEVWWNPGNRRFTVIPRHGGRDLPSGTLRVILRQLDIEPAVFHRPRKGNDCLPSMVIPLWPLSPSSIHKSSFFPFPAKVKGLSPDQFSQIQLKCIPS
jgi:predicted RNA binding protein YcfA (HicA-like mRNA interferase family)